MEAFRFNELEWLGYDINYIRSHVPAEPGIYALSCPKGRAIYVGKADSSVRSRLETYGSPACHNKWIKLYFRGLKLAWSAGQQPANLYFRYWLTNNPAQWEAVAIQMHRLASTGFNQRNEWAPLIHASDACYRVIARSVLFQLEGDELRRFKQSFDVRE